MLCRTERQLDRKIKAKIPHFCNVDENCVITARDCDSIYEVPLLFHEEGLDERVVDKLNMWTGGPNLSRWVKVVQTVKSPKDTIRIAMVGKYANLAESYKSLHEALVHGGIANEVRVEIDYVDSEKLEETGIPVEVKRADGILVPMGFGPRGTEGKITTVHYAREEKVPFLGICFGMQMAVIEFARNVCGLERANSTEVDENTPYPVIHMMTEQRNVVRKGGTMRLGAYDCILRDGSLAYKLYGERKISERHRHRYEVNNEYRPLLSKHGLIFGGLSPDESLVEMIELADHPFFLASQFHPEFKSRPSDPHPMFKGFIRAALQHKAGVKRAPVLSAVAGSR